jgi:hypothetical protein
MPSMRSIMLASSILFFSASGWTQQAAPSQPAPSTSVTDQSSDRKRLEEVLDQYVDAYEHQSLPALVALWPALPNQKKDYESIQRHVNESIFPGSVQSSIEPQDLQIEKDQAKVRCLRHEQYVKVHTSSEVIGGDLRGPKAFGQLPEPSLRTYQRKVVKNRIVTITLHRSGDNWTIISVTEEKPH